MQKATKRQYNKIFGSFRAILTSRDERISSMICTVVEKARTRTEFEPHELYEMALAYGLKHGLVSVGEKVGKYHYAIYFTDKGYKLVEQAQKTTCIFTGRRVRGEWR